MNDEKSDSELLNMITLFFGLDALEHNFPGPNTKSDQLKRLYKLIYQAKLLHNIIFGTQIIEREYRGEVDRSSRGEVCDIVISKATNARLSSLAKLE